MARIVKPKAQLDGHEYALLLTQQEVDMLAALLGASNADQFMDVYRPLSNNTVEYYEYDEDESLCSALTVRKVDG